jgi:predicted phosphodiesterase
MSDEMRSLDDANARSDLKVRAWEFLPQLPLTRSFETVAGQMLLCHGLDDDDMAGVYPFDDALSLYANYPLWKLVNSGKYNFVVNGHTHRRMVRTFDNLTLINAGTIYRKHDPCFCIVDFETGYVQYFRISGEGKIDEIVNFRYRQA